jgi:DNA-directed RNA polymerase specialized sigma24 family protein
MCGLSIAQVAAETDVAEGTVKSRLARARAALVAVMSPGYLTAGVSDRTAERGLV